MVKTHSINSLQRDTLPDGAIRYTVLIDIYDESGSIVERCEQAILTDDEEVARDYVENHFLVDARGNVRRLNDLELPCDVVPETPTEPEAPPTEEG